MASTFTISDTGLTVDGDPAILGEYRYHDRVHGAPTYGRTNTADITIDRDAAVALVRLLADRFDLHLAAHQP